MSSTLFVRGVPEGVTQAQLQTAITGAAKEVTKVNLNERKRFAHVNFESHDAAEKGLKALNKAKIGGQTLEFELSVPKENNQADFDEASNKTVYIRGLATTTETDDVKTAFEEHGEIERVFIINDKKTKSSRGQAVVEYKDRASAEKALELNETELDGQTITVEFAKAPRGASKGGKSHSNGNSAKKPAQKRKASDDDEEEKPAKKAKAETPKKETAKTTPKKETAAASTKTTTPKKESASPKKETPKKAATPSKAKGKK